MKIKNYSLYGKVLDKNGQEHVVTVVGQLVKEKEIVEGVIDNHEVSICGKKEKKVNSTLIVPYKKIRRDFTMAHSICHPDDEFNEEVGKEIALKRLERNPIGTISTYNITMLNDDSCNMLVFAELNYIMKNIDKYI